MVRNSKRIIIHTSYFNTISQEAYSSVSTVADSVLNDRGSVLGRAIVICSQYHAHTHYKSHRDTHKAQCPVLSMWRHGLERCTDARILCQFSALTNREGTRDTSYHSHYAVPN